MWTKNWNGGFSCRMTLRAARLSSSASMLTCFPFGLFNTDDPVCRDKVKKTMGLCIKMNNPVMQLRKIVNHPYLVRWDVDPETGDYVVDEEMITDSGKLTVLDQMLTRLIKDGHRVSSVNFFKSSPFVN